MNKTQKNPSSSGNGTSFSELFQDVFGLEAWAEQKKTPNARRSVPWQWVLWGGLIFFCLGFALSHFSFWVIIVAIAATVIVFLARSTETVEPQVFLLTDERSPEQKHAYKTKSSKTASNRKRPSRRTQSQSTPANLVADNVNEPIETVSKPRRQSRKRASTSKDSNELTPQNSPESRSHSFNEGKSSSGTKTRKPRSNPTRRPDRRSERMNLASNPAEEKTTGTLAEGPSPQTDTHTEASHEAPTSKETQGASSDNNRSM